MTIHAIVRRKRKTKKGRGFSRTELNEAGLGLTGSLKLEIPIDPRRSTKHKENVQTLKAYTRELKPKPAAKEKKERILELTEVKGIGPRTAKKLREARIETANELSSSNPEKIMKATGSSEKKASSFIKDARSLLSED